jgi:hypothetical protein
VRVRDEPDPDDAYSGHNGFRIYARAPPRLNGS